MPCVASSGASEVYTQSMQIDQTAESHPVRCVFAYWLFRLLALQRSSFRENPTYVLTFIGCWVGPIVCETNKHSRSEIESNGHTDTQTQ